MSNSDIIISDRLERLQILYFLWKVQRNTTERNPDGWENSPNISQSLNINEIRVKTHLETLNDRRLILVVSRTREGLIVKIRGDGTVFVEDFFLELEQHLTESNNEKIKNYLQTTKQEHDLIRKHELRMQALITIS